MKRRNGSDRPKQIRKKIIRWLHEEKIDFSERKAVKAFFVLDLDLNGLAATIVQGKDSPDSIYLTIEIALAADQREEFKLLEESLKKDCILDLVNVFAGNCGLGGFEISPADSLDFDRITIATKNIYFDGLTKDRLFSCISDLFRAYAGISSVLEYHTGIAAPARRPTTTLSFYR